MGRRPLGSARRLVYAVIMTMSQDTNSLAAHRPTRPPAIDRPIALVGMMGSGKSTVGRRLARQLSVPFVDSDAEVEAAANCAVSDIFDRYGEEAFRSGEQRVLERLLDGRPKVIATGGGAFIRPETRELIQQRAVSIWLQADLDTLVDRTGRKDNRPLLRGKDRRATLADLLDQRTPVYGEAHIHVASSQGPHAKVVGDIVAALSAYFGKNDR